MYEKEHDELVRESIKAVAENRPVRKARPGQYKLFETYSDGTPVQVRTKARGLFDDQ